MILIAFAIMSDIGRMTLEILTSVALTIAFVLTLLSKYRKTEGKRFEAKEKLSADD
jgi:hypothetical protein